MVGTRAARRSVSEREDRKTEVRAMRNVRVSKLFEAEDLYTHTGRPSESTTVS